MKVWLGRYCVEVTDLDAAVARFVEQFAVNGLR